MNFYTIFVALRNGNTNKYENYIVNTVARNAYRAEHDVLDCFGGGNFGFMVECTAIESCTDTCKSWYDFAINRDNAIELSLDEIREKVIELAHERDLYTLHMGIENRITKLCELVNTYNVDTVESAKELFTILDETVKALKK